MRSRFSAFALRQHAYLWRTLHGAHEDRAIPEPDFVRAVRDATSSLRYLRLSVLDAKDDRVLFLARIFDKGHDRSFVELSVFERERGGWRYQSGEARPAAGAEGMTIDTFDPAAGSSTPDG